MSFYAALEFGLWVILFASMMAAMEIGFRFGVRASAGPEAYDSVALGAVGGAASGVAALLLGFSFSSAGARFFDRSDVLVAEANAIGTTYLRADVFEEPYREQFRKTLRDYTDSRLALSNVPDLEKFQEAVKYSESLQPKMWSAGIAGVRKFPQTAVVVLLPLNQVIDLHTVRLNKTYRHTSLWVLAVIFISCEISLATLGFSWGVRKKRFWFFSACLSILFSVVLTLVIDLDYPRVGLIQVDDSPMRNLRDSFAREPKI